MTPSEEFNRAIARNIARDLVLLTLSPGLFVDVVRVLDANGLLDREEHVIEVLAELVKLARFFRKQGR